VLGDDHPDTLQSINNIGTLFISTGQYDRALPLFDECLAKSRRVLGHDHPDTLETLNNIGALFFKKGDYCRALLHFEDCLARYVRALGNDHPDTKGTRSWRDACKRRLASRLH
jgi:tetratricopeptide (TPR) repeat protein